MGFREWQEGAQHQTTSGIYSKPRSHIADTTALNKSRVVVLTEAEGDLHDVKEMDHMYCHVDLNLASYCIILQLYAGQTIDRRAKRQHHLIFWRCQKRRSVDDRSVKKWPDLTFY
jgi:hypothetical protein